MHSASCSSPLPMHLQSLISLPPSVFSPPPFLCGSFPTPPRQMQFSAALSQGSLQQRQGVSKDRARGADCGIFQGRRQPLLPSASHPPAPAASTLLAPAARGGMGVQTPLGLWFPAGVDVVSLGHLVISRDIFGCHN